MSLSKGLAGALKLAERAKDKRGGHEKQADAYDHSAPDSLGLWQDTYLQSLASLNYAPSTVDHRRFTLRLFLAWAAERELTRAGQVTRRRKALAASTRATMRAMTMSKRRASHWALTSVKLGP